MKNNKKMQAENQNNPGEFINGIDTETIGVNLTTKQKKELTQKVKKSTTKKKADKKDSAKDEKNLSALLDKFKVEKSSASSKSSIYKNIDYSKLSEKDKRKTRKALRKSLDEQISEFKKAVHSGDKKQIEKQFAVFKKYYAETYAVNDWTISSLYGGELNSYQYEYIQNFIDIVKKLNLLKK